MQGFKALPHKLFRSEDGTFGSSWGYTCSNHNIEECFKPNFFRPVRDNLIPGDTIDIVEMVKGRVTAFCEGIIVYKEGNDIDYRVKNENAGITRYPILEPVKEETVVVDPGAPQFIKESGQVQWDRSSRIYTVTTSEGVVFETADKKMAHAVSRGDAPIPKEYVNA